MRGEVKAVLEGGMERLLVLIEAKAVVKVTLPGDTKEEMSFETRVMAIKATGKPLEPPM
jgi:hypothetical protein